MTSAPPPPDDLASRLERLETAEAARRASNRYATAIDTQDFKLLGRCFTADAQLHLDKGREFAGRDAIIDFYRARLVREQGQKHYIVNNDVQWTSPNNAVLTSYLLVVSAGPDVSVIGWGTYIDRIEVIGGIGYIAEKTIIIQAMNDVRKGWATS